ncbi:MAG: efflux RND transporter periplasmic adaptor subunit [Burkholderiales bacterium]|jgi:cobalt-zinc-cadmium efflux system membrane fusion protein|nr:efflux RND transporter periplasmic adaptor subunit [Burkholderiales bacterium]
MRFEITLRGDCCVHNRPTPRAWPILSALALVLAACGSGEHGTTPDRKLPAATASAETSGGATTETSGRNARAEAPDPEIETETLTLQPLARTVAAVATIHQDHHVVANVTARVAGRLLDIRVHVGDRVRRGQVLATLDSFDVGDARMAARTADAQLTLARAEFDRIRPLVDEEVLPRKELVRVQADLDRATAARDAARARLALLGLAPDPVASGRPGSTFTIVAPLDGEVLEKTAVVGELADPARVLFTVGDLSHVWAEANLVERDIAAVREGAAASVTVEAWPGRVFEGRVTYIAATLDAVTRTLLARIEIPNRDGALKPQMPARAVIDAGASVPVLSVPKDAVLLVAGEPTVFVLESDRFVPRLVDPGPASAGRVPLLRGVQAGETVVVRGAFRVKARALASQIGDAH